MSPMLCDHTLCEHASHEKYYEHSYLVSLLFAETFLLTIIFSKTFPTSLFHSFFVVRFLICSSICNVDIAQVIRPSN